MPAELSTQDSHPLVSETSHLVSPYISSRLRDVSSRLRDISSRLRDISSRLRDISSRLRDMSSRLPRHVISSPETSHLVSPDVSTRLRDVSSRLPRRLISSPRHLISSIRTSHLVCRTSNLVSETSDLVCARSHSPSLWHRFGSRDPPQRSAGLLSPSKAPVAASSSTTIASRRAVCGTRSQSTIQRARSPASPRPA
jgi:hypothetical protein